MSKKPAAHTKVTRKFTKKENFGPFQVYTHKDNGLRVLHYYLPDTGVITSNITYKVGSVDETRGESGLAHMLEHMLFKPTKQDLKQGIKNGAAMEFERNSGAILNANTSYDRTTYFFSFPKDHLDTVLEIEANRIQDVVLSDKEFQPERSNVLSEFDMYNGDPYFALEVAMRCAMFQSHAFDHEVIGFREDIEDYTVTKLQRFYEMYYQPNNATLMLIGDLDEIDALSKAEQYFGKKKNPISNIRRETAREPVCMGPKTVTVSRPGTTNILALGFNHEAFPSEAWLCSELAMRVLAGGPESILHKTMVDTGAVSSLQHYISTSSQPNMGLLFLRLADDVSHKEIEKVVFQAISDLDLKVVGRLLDKEKTKMLTDEAFSRTSSLGIAAELTQYATADALEMFTKTEQLLKQVTAKQVQVELRKAFDLNSILTGYYKSV